MSEKQVITLVLANTAATRQYPFTRTTLDQIKELRAKEEAELLEETGKEHMVPAPVIIAKALQSYYESTITE